MSGVCRLGFRLIAAAVLAGPAFAKSDPAHAAAQSPPASQLPARTGLGDDASSEMLLAGPSVNVAPEAGRPAGMGGPNANRTNRRANEIPLRQWMRALREVGLSGDQRRSIKAIADEFQAAVTAHQQSFSEKEREQIQQAVEARRSGGGRVAADSTLSDLLARAEQRRPRPSAFQERIWAVLTPEQQSRMKSALDVLQRSRQLRTKPGDRFDEVPASQPDRSDVMSDAASMNETMDAEVSSEPKRTIKPEDGTNERKGKRRRGGNRVPQPVGREPEPQDMRFDFDETDDR